MKKIFASLAAGLIIASAVPVMAAEAGNQKRVRSRQARSWETGSANSETG